METYLLYPEASSGDSEELEQILEEIAHHLQTRADGIRITIKRHPDFPLERGKQVIARVEIETWDCAA